MIPFPETQFTYSAHRLTSLCMPMRKHTKSRPVVAAAAPSIGPMIPAIATARESRHDLRRPMDQREIFHRYVRERREQEIEGQRRETLPFLTRYTPVRPGADGLVTYAEIPSGLEGEVIGEQLRFFVERKLNFEWKVYSFDTPANLRELLLQRGFVAEAVESFAVLPLDELTTNDELPAGIEIRRVVDSFGISAMVAVQRLIWKKDFSWLGAALEETLEHQPDELFGVLALSGGKPVGCGWMDFPPKSQFADLHGGCVLPEHRGRGIYQAMLTSRITEAQRRGIQFLTADAAPMSRPIVERAGFQVICETWPMKWRQPSADQA